MSANKTNDRRRALKRRLAFLLFNVIGYPVLWVLLRLWPLTLRWRMHGEQAIYDLLKAGQPLIFAFWHSDLMGIYWNGRMHVKASRINIMISPSRDGKLLMRLVRLMGYRSVTGSSASRGVSGLKSLLEVLKRGDYVAMALDGPRGPRQEIKPGALFLAQQTGAAIIPVIYHIHKKWVVKKSWDRQELPKPFSSIDVDVLPPVNVPADMPHDELVGAFRQAMEEKMKAVKNQNARDQA